MNDLYGVEPGAYRSSTEWRMHLAAFGPQTGCYILCLPGFQLWRKEILSRLSDLGDMEQARIMTVLSNAFKDNRCIDKDNFDHWRGREEWLSNALNYWRLAKGRYKKIFVHEGQYENTKKERPEDLKYLISVDDDPKISPADREIETEPENYWEAVQLLCSISAHIHFIDPYLDLSKKDVSDVFINYIGKIANLKKVMEVHFWVREPESGELGKKNENIRNIIKRATEGKRKGIKIFLYWIHDYESKEKMHARYLLTEKGGIKFDQGFQRIRPKGRKNIISPVGNELCQNLFEKYSKKNFDCDDFKIIDTLKIVL